MTEKLSLEDKKRRRQLARKRAYNAKNRHKMAAYYRERVGHWREAKLMRMHGLDLVGYGLLLREQGGVCGICERPPVGPDKNDKNLRVDHDHTTGAIRGLLCNRCNIRLGLLELELTDAWKHSSFRKDLRTKALAYLKKHRNRAAEESNAIQR